MFRKEFVVWIRINPACVWQHALHNIWKVFYFCIKSFKSPGIFPWTALCSRFQFALELCICPCPLWQPVLPSCKLPQKMVPGWGCKSEPPRKSGGRKGLMAPKQISSEKLCLVLHCSGRGGEKTVSGLEYFQHLGRQVNFKQSPAGIQPVWGAQCGSFLFPFHHGPGRNNSRWRKYFQSDFP